MRSVVRSSQTNYRNAHVFCECRLSSLVCVLEWCLQLINPCVSVSYWSRKHFHVPCTCAIFFSIRQNPAFPHQILGSCFRWILGWMVYDLGCETRKNNTFNIKPDPLPRENAQRFITYKSINGCCVFSLKVYFHLNTLLKNTAIYVRLNDTL